MRISDWSSDVCSSDLHAGRGDRRRHWHGDWRPDFAGRRSRRRDADLPRQDDDPIVADVTDQAQDLQLQLAQIQAAQQMLQIGKASCRERRCQYVEISVVAVSIKKKKRINVRTT